MRVIERSTQSAMIQMEVAELKILTNSLNKVIHVISSANFSARIGIPREQAEELQKTILGNKCSTILLSIRELIALGNVLNEVVNGIYIDNFESVIGDSVGEVKMLLKSTSDLIKGFCLESQDCESPQSVDRTRKESMERQICSLISKEYQADFYLRSLTAHKDSVGIVVVLTRLTAPGAFSVKSVAQILSIHKLQNFAEYLEQHIILLQNDFEHESSNFLQCKSIFQCHALSKPSCEGIAEACTLRFMISISEESDVFIGAEAAITFDSISHFTNSVNAFLAQLSG